MERKAAAAAGNGKINQAPGDDHKGGVNMIDKISGNSSYDYPSHNDAGKSPALQAYEHTPGKKGSLKQKSTGSRSTDSAAKAAGREQKGVILDLSAKGKE